MADITEVLRDLSIDFRREGQHHHAHRGWVNVDCPWCGERNRFHMGFSLRSFACNCWICGSHRVVDSLAKASGRPIPEILQLTRGMSFGDWKRPETDRRQELRIPDGLEETLSNLHWRYLEGRGFNPSRIVSTFRIRTISGLSSWKNYRWRIFIPLFFRGEMVSWLTRSVGDREPRYRNAPLDSEKMRAKDLLYGEDLARSSIIVCEGPTDVWRIGPGAVATMGMQVTERQVIRMLDYPVRIVCFDRSRSAQNRAFHLCRKLTPHPGTTINVLLDSDDPGCATKEEVQDLRKMLV